LIKYAYSEKNEIKQHTLIKTNKQRAVPAFVTLLIRKKNITRSGKRTKFKF
jgi:hypothetical protein